MLEDPRLTPRALDRIHDRLTAAGHELPAPTTLRLAPRGGSNVTCFVRFGDRELVLRLPPQGPSADGHDVVREGRLMQRLASTEVPVPEILFCCDDTDVIGSPFVVSRMATGQALDPGADLPPQEVPEYQRALLGTLAIIHRLEPERAFDRTRTGIEYLERQVGIWSHQLERSGHREGWSELSGWVSRNLPTEAATSVVHGDYGAHNVMFAERSPHEVSAVFDWELSTVGDPAADLAWFLIQSVRLDPDPSDEANHLQARTGSLGSSELMDVYFEAGGKRPDPGALRFYEVFARWKLGIILLGLSAGARGRDEAALADHHARRAVRQRDLAAEAIEGRLVLRGTAG